MRKLLLSIKSLCQWLLIGLLALIVVPLALLPCALLATHLKPIRTQFYRASSWFCRCILRIARLNIKIVHPENLLLKQPAIIIMNHSSSFDIPLLESLMKGTAYVWLSKASYKKIPIGGTILRLMHVAVDRMHAAAGKSLTAFIDKADRFNAHMLMFPEGTRHTDGKLHAFKTGFAFAAEQTGRPVLPIIVKGLCTVLPKHGFLIDSSDKTITIIVGAPLLKNSAESREAFVQRVHHTCTSMLDEAL